MNEAVRIQATVAECHLGLVLVAATAKGVCLIAFGDHAADLRAELSLRSPRAQLVDCVSTFADWVAQVLRIVEAPSRGLELPLDIWGTDFQRRVWKALQAIPPGRTATYAELARAIGSPRAVRAAAGACAANPLAVVIPCHRVIGSNGKLTGYRWGVHRKRALLDREAGF